MRTMLEYVQNLWPFTTLIFYNNHDDLKASDAIVRKLSISESTKHFVYAIREPESQAVIYVLAVQKLSERSALDAECLIWEIKPDAVVVQVEQLSECEMIGLREDRIGLVEDGNGGGFNVPTSVFEVLMNCFVHRINKESYEDVAGSLVLREIFGVSFNGHLIAAKKAAEEVGSSFLMLESPFVKCNLTEDDDDDSEGESGGGDSGGVLNNVFSVHPSSLASQRKGSSISSLNSRAFRVLDEVQSQTVKYLTSCLLRASPPLKSTGEGGGMVRPQADYEAPQFSRGVYPLLVDLHRIFSDIPSMSTALACAQKILCDVNKGEITDNRVLSEVYAFQIAVEGLRIAMNKAGRVVMDRCPPKCEFSDLPEDDQTHAIVAQALQSQTKKYKSIVAVVDASRLSGLRKNWKTHVPPKVKCMADQLVISLDEDGETSNESNRKWKLTNKPVVAVGAGATAVVGASSLTKVVPASTLIKVATLSLRTSLQLAFAQPHKAVLFALGKTNWVAPGMVKGSTLKAVVVHGVIASAEKTSLSAMRLAFYRIMRRRQVQRVGVAPWATFGCSVAVCAGLLAYGDGIECAAESVPAARSIADLGRGIQNLHEASKVIREAESDRVQRSIESLLHKFKNFKVKVQ